MPVRSVLPPGWSGAGAPGGASQGQSPARGAPDAAPRSGALMSPLARETALDGRSLLLLAYGREKPLVSADRMWTWKLA